jgi:hypothetical protein
MMEPMLAACPSFGPKWKEFLTEWVDNPILEEDGQDGSLPQYLALSALATHLIEHLEAGKTEEFAQVFAVVEHWINHGDAYVTEAAVVGLLEDLQNANLHGATEPADFEKWRLPESKRWWEKVARFWSHGEVLRDD